MTKINKKVPIRKAVKKKTVKKKKAAARRVFYRLPAVLVELGKALELGLTSGRSIKFKSGFLLGSNVSGDRLFVLPVERRISKSGVSTGGGGALVEQAKKLYKRFTDFQSSKSYKLKITDYILKKIGNAAFVAYRSDKWSGKNVDYIHTFDAITELWADDADEKKARLFALRGSIAVKKEGITG